MKHRRYLCASIVICAFLYLLSGCFTQPPAGATPPEDIYASAISKLNFASGLSIQVNHNKRIQYYGQTFEEVSVQNYEYRNIGTDQFCASITESITIGQHLIETESTLIDSNVYLHVNDGYFSQQSADLTAYDPHFYHLSPALYGTVSSAELYGRTVIAFSQPSAAEPWAVSDEVEFVTAAGIAVLDKHGELQRVQYALQYAISDTVIYERYLIDITISSHGRIEPVDYADYTPVVSIDAPVLLEKACGYLLQAQCIATNVTETLDSEIGGLLRSQSTQLRISGDGNDLNAFIDTGIMLTNSSRGDETTTMRQTEHFQNGEYRLQTNGNITKPGEEVTADALRRYCNDILVGSIPLPGYITSAELTENDDVLELDFLASDKLAAMISTNACQVLYQDASLLDSISSEYTINELSCNLRIDKVLGIPVACSLKYSASHTIEGAVYSISSETEQTFSLIDKVFE